MMRQKHFWEIRIKELGGKEAKKGSKKDCHNMPIQRLKLSGKSVGRQYYDIEGKELPGAPGYKYYGAAKELPGVIFPTSF